MCPLPLPPRIQQLFLAYFAKDLVNDPPSVHCWRVAMSLELEPDVIINVHKGQGGYGIYFAQREEGMVVTKLDPGSEAMKAGVMPPLMAGRGRSHWGCHPRSPG